MKRTTVFFDEQVERELRAAARRERRPAASIVREAVEQYILAHRAVGRRTMGFVAVGGSGRTDTAERSEELLWADGDTEREVDTGRRPSKPATRRRTRSKLRPRSTVRAGRK